MNVNFMKKQDGLSLVELMITLSLLGIVLALGYMYFDYGVQAFDRGERQSIAQQASRITSDFVTAELRFAKEIEINPEGGISEAGYRYIYLDDDTDSDDTDSIVFRDEEGNERILASSQADGMPYFIKFDSNIPDDVVIFDIEADNGLYELHTRVQALNLELYRTFTTEGELISLNEDATGIYTIIKYRVPTRD